MKSSPRARYNSGSSRMVGILTAAIDRACPRVAHLQRILMRGQIASQLLGLSSNLSELKRAGVLRPISNGVTNFCLRRFAEPRQLRHPPRFAGRLQIRDGADF